MSEFMKHRNDKISLTSNENIIIGFTPCFYMPRPWIDYGGSEITDIKIREKILDYYLEDASKVSGMSKDTIIRKIFKVALDRLLTIKKESLPSMSSLGDNDVDPYVNFYVNNETIEPPNYLHTNFVYSPDRGIKINNPNISIEKAIYNKDRKAVIAMKIFTPPPPDDGGEGESSSPPEIKTVANLILPLFHIGDKYIFEYKTDGLNVTLYYKDDSSFVEITKDDKMRLKKTNSGLNVRSINYDYFKKYIPTVEDMKQFILTELITVFFYLQCSKHVQTWITDEGTREEEVVFISRPYNNARKVAECGREFNRRITNMSVDPRLKSMKNIGDFYYYYGYLVIYGIKLYKFSVIDKVFTKLYDPMFEPYINLDILKS